MSAAALVIFYSSLLGGSPAALTGRVADGNGAPIAGARVDLWTARPRVGLSITCPSCYRDCAKWANSNPQGEVSIDDLDPTLLFRVLVVAPGYRPIVTPFVDPAAGELEFTLEAVPADLPADQTLRGIVLDDRGKPLAGAIVSPFGAKTAGRRWYGRLPGVDEAAVSDAGGEFVITSQGALLGLDVEVEAPGYAICRRELLEFNGERHEVQLRRGAIVTGSLSYEGKPVRRRPLGIVQRNRSAVACVGEVTQASDDSGAFAFANLQPNERYVLYSLCDGTDDLPVLKTTSLQTRGDLEVTELGELPLIDGLVIAGKVEVPPGAALPEGALLRIERDPAFDWCELPLADDGAFEARGLPPEVYSIDVIAPGFELDAARLRYQATSQRQFGLRLRSNLRDLQVPLVPTLR